VGLLIAARGVQGVGAAAMFATTMALISNTYTGRERGMAFGIWGAVNGAASAVGPIIGGLLTANFGWRWIFLVNLPVSVVAVAMTLKVIGESKDPNPKRIDLPGMVSFTVAAAALTYALIRGAWASTETITLIAVTAVALAVFVIAERRNPAPMLDLKLLRNRTFTAMLLAGALLSAAAWAAMTYQSLWLQSVLGLSAIKAGLVVLPCAASAFLVSGQVGRFLHRTSPRWMVGLGLLVIAVGALAQAVLRENSSWPVVIPGLVLVGIGAGLAMASLTSTAMSAVPWQQAGMAGGALSAFRQLGYALGIAVLGEVFDSGLSHGLSHGAGPGLSAALSGGQAQAVLARTPALAPVVHRAFADGLDFAYVVAGGFGLLAAVLVFTLVRQRPQAGAAAAAGEPRASEPAPASAEA
jgi:EmrB/QacA subfamily drug resistance transporter